MLNQSSYLATLVDCPGTNHQQVSGECPSKDQASVDLLARHVSAIT